MRTDVNVLRHKALYACARLLVAKPNGTWLKPGSQARSPT
jgi:hypothetical protein